MQPMRPARKSSSSITTRPTRLCRRAYAVLNPNRQDDLSGQGHLAAAGVVFLFLVAATRALRREGYLSRPRPSPICSACSISWRSPPFATWCRSRTRTAPSWPRGSRCCGLRNNHGLRALADAARIDAAPTATRSASSWVPASMPAAGSARRASAPRLLATDDEIEARAIAAKLEALNAERKAIEERMLEEAFASRRGRARRRRRACPLLFLAAEGWHKGLLGLDRRPRRRALPPADLHLSARA